MRHPLLTTFLSACTLAAQPAPGTGSIEGRITNAVSGAPVRKAIVYLNSPMIHLVAESDADGRFQFSALPPGTYAMKSSHSGYFEYAARRPIVLSDDQHMSGAEVRLAPQAVVSGRVIDAEGEPSPGATVLLLKQGYQDGHRVWYRASLITKFDNGGSLEELSAKTNDAGDYRIEHVPAGSYLVLANTDRPVVDNQYGAIDSADHPRMANVPVYYPNAAEESMASPVAVAAGSVVQGVDIRISRAPTYHISGRLTGLPATFTNRVEIYLRRSDNAPAGQTGEAVPPDYSFDLAVPRGQYVLRAGEGKDDKFFATASIFVSGSISDMIVPMRARSQVSGRFTSGEQDKTIKLQGIDVYLWEDTGNASGSESSDAAGNFAFPEGVPPGRYALGISPEKFPEGYFVQKIRVGGRDVPAAGISSRMLRSLPVSGDFEIQGSTDIEVVLSATAGKITGSVTDEDAKPVPNATVTMIPSDGSLADEAQADGNGSFGFSHLRPGDYRLYAWEEVDEDVWQDPEFLKQHEADVTRVTVGPGESQSAQLKVVSARVMK